MPSKKTLTLTLVNDIYLFMSQVTKNDDIIPLEKLVRLRQKGNTLRDIGKIENCSHVNVHKRLHNEDFDYDEFIGFKEDKTLSLELKQYLVSKQLTVERIQKLSPYQMFLVMAIIQTKLNEMSAGSTAQVNILNQIVINLDKTVRSELKSKGIQDVVIDVPHNDVKKLSD